MNDVNGILGIEDEDNLKVSTGRGLTPNDEFPVTFVSRIRLSGTVDQALCFRRTDSMLGDMVEVPSIPTEFKDSHLIA